MRIIERLYSKVSASDKTVNELAKTVGYKLPSESIAVFKSVYAKIEEANKNGVRLDRKAVLEALPTLIGCQANLNHWRKGYIVGSIFWAGLNEQDEIEIAFTFFKSVYPKEYKEATNLLKNGELTVSFELSADKDTQVLHADGTRTLMDFHFDGVGLLLDESPAYPNAIVYETAKELIDNTSLVFASENTTEYKNLVSTLQEILKVTASTKGGEQIMTLEGKDIQNTEVTTEPIITPSVVVAGQKLCPECNQPIENDECATCKTKKASEVIAPVVEASTEVVAPVEQATVFSQTVETTETTVVEENNSVDIQTVKQIQSVEVNTESGETKEVNEITIRNSKWTLPQIEEKMQQDENAISQLTAKVSELELALKNKDEEIVKAKEEAVRIERIKVELGEYVKEFKDEDFADKNKLEIARLRKENDVLKSKSNNTDVAENIETANITAPSKDLDTGHEEVTASDETKGTLVNAVKESIKKYKK
jgi:hypothetical protein